VLDNPELASRVAALSAAMNVGENSIFLPMGTVFLTITAERMGRLKQGKLADPTTGVLLAEDAWSAYSEWHEMVHMSQLVTCPYVMIYAIRLASLAMQASGEDSDVGDGERLRGLVDEFRFTKAMFDARSGDGFSAWEIIETQAVVQALLWLTGSNPKGARTQANSLYREVRRAPQYLPIIDATCDRFGDTAAMTLLPRLCYLALQTDEPSQEFTELCTQVGDEAFATRLAAASPREFCEWASRDARRESRSLRERAPSLADHPWMRFFGLYFDDFERVAGVDERLTLLLGARGGDAFRMFHPMLTIYSDGQVKLWRASGTKIDDRIVESWIDRTSEVLHGLALLDNPVRPIRHSPTNAGR
jgi:hypothetical protein